MKKQETIRSLKFIGWGLLIFLIVGAIALAVKNKKAAKTKSVEIQIQPLPIGNNLITKGDVHTLLNKSFGFDFDGMPQGAIDIERIERILKEDAFILNADAYIDAENIIQLEIQQRIPILRIIDKMQVSYYLDENGKRLPLSKNFTARVLIASGNIPPFIPDFQEREQHLLQATFELSKKIIVNDFLWSMVEQIYINNKNEFILVPKLGKQKILLGQYAHIDDKLENLEIFYKKVIAQEGWQKYKTFDLTYKDQVVGVR